MIGRDADTPGKRPADYGRTLLDDLYYTDPDEVSEPNFGRYRALYRRIADCLSEPLPSTQRASVSVIAQYLFRKRNAISVTQPSESYRAALARDLPRRASTFMPEIRSLLHALDLDCDPADFDNAILVKLDVRTQGLAANRNPIYFTVKGYYSRLENCETANDLLLRGLFLARARHNVKRIARAAVLLIVAVLALLYVVS